MKNLYDESIMWGTHASVKNIDNKKEYINDYLIEDYEIGHTGEMMNWRLNVIAIYTDLLLKLFKNYEE